MITFVAANPSKYGDAPDSSNHDQHAMQNPQHYEEMTKQQFLQYISLLRELSYALESEGDN